MLFSSQFPLEVESNPFGTLGAKMCQTESPPGGILTKTFVEPFPFNGICLCGIVVIVVLFLSSSGIKKQASIDISHFFFGLFQFTQA